jgi:hypothetical protein
MSGLPGNPNLEVPWRPRIRRIASLRCVFTPFALADKAECLVDANRRATARACPLGLLSLNKTRQPVGFYDPQILDHAHAIFHAVSLVQATKSLTREPRTVRAEIPANPASRTTTLDSARDARLRLAAIISSATRASIPVAQKCATKGAIHAARCDKLSLIQVLGCRAFGHRLAAQIFRDGQSFTQDLAFHVPLG